MLVKIVVPPKKPDMQVAPELDRSTRLRSYFPGNHDEEVPQKCWVLRFGDLGMVSALGFWVEVAALRFRCRQFSHG